MTEPKKAMRISPAPMADNEFMSVNDTPDLYSFKVAWYPAPVHKPMMYTPRLVLKVRRMKTILIHFLKMIQKQMSLQVLDLVTHLVGKENFS